MGWGRGGRELFLFKGSLAVPSSEHCLHQAGGTLEHRDLCPKLGSKHTRMAGRGGLSHREGNTECQGGPPQGKRHLSFKGVLLLFPQSAQEYRQRSLLEKELLFFAYDVFGIPFVDPVSQGRGRRKRDSTEGWGSSTMDSSGEKTARG